MIDQCGVTVYLITAVWVLFNHRNYIKPLYNWVPDKFFHSKLSALGGKESKHSQSLIVFLHLPVLQWYTFYGVNDIWFGLQLSVLAINCYMAKSVTGNGGTPVARIHIDSAALTRSKVIFQQLSLFNYLTFITKYQCYFPLPLLPRELHKFSHANT